MQYTLIALCVNPFLEKRFAFSMYQGEPECLGVPALEPKKYPGLMPGYPKPLTGSESGLGFVAR